MDIKEKTINYASYTSAVGVFRPNGPIGYKSRHSSDAPLRSTREEAYEDYLNAIPHAREQRKAASLTDTRSKPAYIRLDVDTFKEPWLKVLSPEARFAWVNLLLTARSLKGRIPSLEPATLARLWDISESAATEMLDAAVRGGALMRESSNYEVSNWDNYLLNGGKK